LAAVLHAISERVRAVRTKASDVAIQKLEALRNMERSLLRERVLVVVAARGQWWWFKWRWRRIRW
jgi:hypothetical protein